MTIKSKAICEISGYDHEQFGSWNMGQDTCITCGLCSSVCPVSGLEHFNPRKVVRMVSLGLKNELIDAKWPWICTMCGKCESVCHMDINIPEIMRGIRSLRERKDVPGILQKGLDAAIETGNNLRLPREDYTFILEDVGEEIAEEPGFENFTVPIDKKGANLLTTIHNKLVNTHTEDLKHWWKIFYAAKEDWTVPSTFWEGTNWGFFTGDDESMKTMVGRILDHMVNLEIKNLMWPE
jgi:heterodisulfide reductase subunit C